MRIVAGFAGFFLLAAAAAAQTTPSADLARQLVTTLGGAGLDAIAARDPEAPDRVVAALAFPGSQLLVVAAPYRDGATVDAWLANRMYRDVYSALQQPSITTGKVFFQDLGCDGLRPGGDGSIDIMYEDGKTQTIFDGNWKKQKLSEAAYQQRVRDADARYAKLLTALLGAVPKQPR
jgi:hypothetical protein